MFLEFLVIFFATLISFLCASWLFLIIFFQGFRDIISQNISGYYLIALNIFISLLEITCSIVLLFAIYKLYISDSGFKTIKSNPRPYTNFNLTKVLNFYEKLTDKNSFFFIDSLKFIKKIQETGFELRNKDKLYFLFDIRFLMVNGLLNIPGYDNKHFLDFYTKNKSYFDKLSDYSIIIPLGYNHSETILNARHTVLCIIEKINGVSRLYIANSHPGNQYSNNIINTIRELFQSKGIKISRYESVGCGTQTDNYQCLKYTMKLIYNYIDIGENFEDIRSIICPGYTLEQNQSFIKDEMTSRRSQVKYLNRNKVYKHLSENDILYLESLK